MQVDVHPPVSSSPRNRTLKLFAGVSLLCALILVAVVGLYARTPDGALASLVKVLATASALLGTGAVVLGIRWLLRADPALKRPLLFVAVVTAGTLLAHLYIVNSPATANSMTLSGTVNSNFHDSQLNVTSALSGSQLRVNVVNIGSNAIGYISISLDSAPLPSANLTPLPNYTTPLQPSSLPGFGFPTDSQGVWSVQANDSSQIDVGYQSLSCYHVPNTSDRRGVFGCVMDETYYVPSAMGILSGIECAPYADS